jgi:hypothetical protein
LHKQIDVTENPSLVRGSTIKVRIIAQSAETKDQIIETIELTDCVSPERAIVLACNKWTGFDNIPIRALRIIPEYIIIAAWIIPE